MPEQIPVQQNQTKVVLAAKFVRWALVTYKDDAGTEYTQLAIVGDNNIHLTDAKLFAISRNATPQGPANDWLRDGAFAKLGITK